MGEQPRYPHDCPSCVFLGRFNEFDLYYHAYGVVAARGETGQKADWLDSDSDQSAELAEARRRTNEYLGKVKPCVGLGENP